MVGRATSGVHGHTVATSLALAYVRPEVAAEGTALEIVILGKRFPATVVADSPYDPENAALRA